MVKPTNGETETTSPQSGGPDEGATPAVADAPRRRFGRYELVEPLRIGGTGDVYRARDVRHDRWVALAILPPSYGSDRDAMDRFRERMSAVASLENAHLLPVYGFGKIGRRPYIEMQLVDGEDLETVLERHGPLEPSRAVHLIGQMAAALDAVHAAGVVHGDVGPRTILIHSDDEAYLTDVGISRPVGVTQTSLTVAGEAPGRLDCVPPERLTGRGLDERADVYSLACVLVLCLTGERPYPADDLPSLLHAHLYLDPPTVAGAQDGIPPALDEVVRRAMAKAPEDRFPTAGEFADAVRRAMAVTEPVAPSMARPADDVLPPWLEPVGVGAAAAPRRTARVRVAAVVVSCLAILAALAVVIWGPSGDAEETRTSPAAGTDPEAQASGSASGDDREEGGSASGLDREEGGSASGPGTEEEDVDGGPGNHGGAHADPDSGPVASLPRPKAGPAVPVGEKPHEVAVAPDGRTAYIADPSAGAVIVFDTASRSPTATIPIPEGPPQMVSVSLDGSQAYVSVFTEDYSKNAIAVIDTRRRSVVDSIPVGRGPYAAEPSPKGNLLYVPLFDEPHVEVVDLDTGAVVDRITGAPNPHWIAFTDNGRFGYTANHFSDVVTVLDLFSHTVVETIEVGDAPHSIETAPDGSRVAVVNYVSGDISFIDPAKNKVVDTVAVGAGPQDVTYAPDGRHVYTANVDDGTVSVVDTATGSETARIPTGRSPTSVEVLPDGRTAFVTNFDGGTVRPLETGKR